MEQSKRRARRIGDIFAQLIGESASRRSSAIRLLRAAVREDQVAIRFDVNESLTSDDLAEAFAMLATALRSEYGKTLFEKGRNADIQESKGGCRG